MEKTIKCWMTIYFFSLLLSSLQAQTGSLEKFYRNFFSNQFDSARVEIEKSIQQDSSTAHLYFFLGKTCLAMNDYDAAIRAFQSSIRKGYLPGQAYEYIGQIFEEQGRLADAIDAYQVALKMNPNLTRLRLKMVSLYFKRKNYRAAIAQGKHLVRQDSTQMQAYYLVGRSYLQRSEDDSALSVARQAVFFDSSSVPNLLNLGIALFKKGKHDSSILVLRQTLELNSRSDEAKFYLAKNLVEKDKMVEAIRLLKDCVRLEGMYRLKAMKLLVQYLYQTGQLIETIRRAQDYLAEKPDEGMVHYYLARSLSDRGELDAAEKEFEKAALFSGQDFIMMIYFYRGLNYYQNGRDGKAIFWYKKVLSINPNFSYAYYNLALVYDRYYEDKSTAIRYYKKFIELAKEDKSVPSLVIVAAKERLAQLREKRFFGR